MASEKTIQQQLQELVDSELSQAEITGKLDATLPSGCQRTVDREEEYSKECLESTGNPYRYRHCITITDCPDPSDNMSRTCGQWRCA